MKDRDKYRGCLVGGAVGDALGYAVEFSDESSIFARYGKMGITSYAVKDGIAQISDDTQMTLFTATGLLLGTTRGMTHGIMGSYSDYVRFSYRDWYKTQMCKYPSREKHHYSWLMNVPEMYARRAPGNTCLSALADHDTFASIEHPVNKSKGCGGVMRVAPIGLYFEEQERSLDEIDMIGAQVAAITHGHSLGYIPAAALVHIVNILSHREGVSIQDAVNDMLLAIKRLFAHDKHLKEFTNKIEEAIDLSQDSTVSTLEAIHKLGEGWVAEETLAIAVYCSLKWQNDFEKAIIAAVNHRGDSDSTGAVTGNILGASLGLNAIPLKYLDCLELKSIILDIADDLYDDCQLNDHGTCLDKIWEKKYLEND